LTKSAKNLRQVHEALVVIGEQVQVVRAQFAAISGEIQVSFEDVKQRKAREQLRKALEAYITADPATPYIEDLKQLAGRLPGGSD
jgi:hypothetical protein